MKINIEYILQNRIEPFVKEGLCVAFSGGVDSSLLLKIAADIGKNIGREVHGVTFETRLHPKADLENARKIAEEVGAIHHVIYVDELKNPEILYNPVNRCYLCKKQLFEELTKYANGKGLKHIVDGTNYEDLSEYRPGLKALAELGIQSPLANLAITKEEVRELAKNFGMAVSKRPSAPCLATRLPYGTKIDFALLECIDEGENYLKDIGFAINRIRVHGDVVRIEIPKTDFSKFLEKEVEITEKLKDLGFIYITLDLEGFRSGSMDVKLV